MAAMKELLEYNKAELIELLWESDHEIYRILGSSSDSQDALEAIKKIRRAGISLYNQQVFTYYNSKRYESCLLRKVLKKSGIDPYYTFNTKGKDETIDYSVPIARIEQERKEEERFLPGIVKTDEPIFNVPSFDYLKRLNKDNENVNDYSSIWYISDESYMLNKEDF